MLRDDALRAELAGLRKDCRAVALEVLAVLNPRRGVCEEFSKPPWRRFRAVISFDHAGVTFKWKDYRAKGHQRAKVMTLASDEFIRRFLPANRLQPHPPLRPVRQQFPR